MNEKRKIRKFSNLFKTIHPLKRKEFSRTKRVDGKIILDFIETQRKLKFN